MAGRLGDLSPFVFVKHDVNGKCFYEVWHDGVGFLGFVGQPRRNLWYDHRGRFRAITREAVAIQMLRKETSSE